MRRQPKGLPTGGQFTGTDKTESAAVLAAGADAVSMDPLNDPAQIARVDAFAEKFLADHQPVADPADLDSAFAVPITPIRDTAWEATPVTDHEMVEAGEAVMARLDAAYDDLDHEQRAYIKSLEREYRAKPYLWLGKALGGPAGIAVGTYDAARNRHIWTNDTLCKYAAYIKAIEGRDPAKGIGKERLSYIRAALQARSEG